MKRGRQDRIRGQVRTLIFAALTCFILLSGCARTAARTTEKGVFHITLTAKGTLLRFGRNEIDLQVTDDKDAGVEGAQIEITPWMPEHSHGALWSPTVIEKGKGIYRAVIPLTMAGHWELRIRIVKGDRQDSVVFDFPHVKK